MSTKGSKLFCNSNKRWLTVQSNNIRSITDTTKPYRGYVRLRGREKCSTDDDEGKVLCLWLSLHPTGFLKHHSLEDTKTSS